MNYRNILDLKNKHLIIYILNFILMMTEKQYGHNYCFYLALETIEVRALKPTVWIILEIHMVAKYVPTLEF